MVISGLSAAVSCSLLNRTSLSTISQSFSSKTHNLQSAIKFTTLFRDSENHPFTDIIFEFELECQKLEYSCRLRQFDFLEIFEHFFFD